VRFQEAEKARRKYAECYGAAKDRDGRIDQRKLEDCLFGKLAPYRHSNFRKCWYAPSKTTWECFREAYLRS
jgi:hypothetical protein